jgi:hypothetical protein
MNHEIAIKIKRKGWEENITLGWFASLIGSCSLRVSVSPCRPWPRGFFLEEKDEREWNDRKCVRMDLQSTREAILLAVGVHREWWLAGVHWWEYQTAGFFSLDVKGFFIEQCSWLPNKDFLWILHQGARVCAYSARGKVPECVQNSEDSYAQIKEVITGWIQKINFHFYCRNSITPSTN